MAELSRYGVTQRWSDVVVAGNLAFFVEVPDDTSLPAEAQFRMLFQQVEDRCRMIGTDLTELVQVLIYLPYVEDLPVFNALWDAWIPEGYAPSRACSHPPLADPNLRAELILTAYVASRPESPCAPEPPQQPVASPKN